MLHKDLFNEPRDAFYWVERVLHEHKDYFLSKEEIYAQIPTDREGVCIVTISAMDNALRNLAKMGHINVEYHQGRRYFNYREERKRYD